MAKSKIISGFSKLSKDDKIKLVSEYFDNPAQTIKEFKSFWHKNKEIQKLLDEFSENTITNFYFPYGISPNFIINNKNYLLPLVIEESSVVAAASNSAKFWSTRGGFHAKVVSSVKVGQVHFSWRGDLPKLKSHFEELKLRLIKNAKPITAKMEERGGGILDIELMDMTHEIVDYYQLKATFETVDSMGANFINSCLEDFAMTLRSFLYNMPYFEGQEKECNVIMSILSNYTPDCLIQSWVECDIADLGPFDDGRTVEEFVKKFEMAVKIAQVDTFRATTHNKGIFNGIDAVVLATGNDFRAVEAAGHTYASRDGKYRSLTKVNIENGKFKYILTIPMALGTVGGLTSLHPLAKLSLELLGQPSANELMMIAATAGLANNFGAITTLVTKGIQKGHMKMHLLNILNNYNATDSEKIQSVEHFKDKKVSFNAVREFLDLLRK
ncbi:MAG: hydroxymethylglutaryl-CoA reductase, degradative [Bacteroidetes bacterium]|nr:hydroxymethylglutaryl-CoA reductase, degradative [Bacteroidota bacterium]